MGEGCTAIQDKATVAAAAQDRYSLRLELFFDNGHTCGFDGSGHLTGEMLVATTPVMPGCPVRARFQDDAMVLEMDGHECRAYFCGVRGSIDGARLYRDAKR